MGKQEKYMVEFHIPTGLVVYFKGFTYNSADGRGVRVATDRHKASVLNEERLLDVLNKVKYAILADNTEIHVTKWDEELTSWLQVMSISTRRKRLS